jgi:hypothetical protein
MFDTPGPITQSVLSRRVVPSWALSGHQAANGAEARDGGMGAPGIEPGTYRIKKRPGR